MLESVSLLVVGLGGGVSDLALSVQLTSPRFNDGHQAGHVVSGESFVVRHSWMKWPRRVDIAVERKFAGEAAAAHDRDERPRK